jgi:hypothetical protein
MSAALTLADAARIMRTAVRDRSYRATPLGTMVARYLRWFRNERGATEASIRDYEAILARMSIALADKHVHEVQIDELREVIDLWAAQSSRTPQKVTSVILGVPGVGGGRGPLAISPALRIRRPKPRPGWRAPCRWTPGPESWPPRSTHATASRCSAYLNSGCAATNSPASSSATSTPNAAGSTSAARDRRKECSRCGDQSSPSSASS